jgi:MoaA/NifB/PqqE/SkfB family radical SAM enzyme
MPNGLDLAYRRFYEGVNYRLRTMAGGRLAQHCRPTSIMFLLTELCTARCLHCDIWKNNFREESPTVDQWKQTLTDIRSWLGPVHVLFTGGEALMKGFTTDLVAHAHEQGLFLEILSHGYWKDQKKIERLAMAKPWRVTISLDGVGETHSRVRGWKNFWEMTSTTISTLRRMRQENALPYHIRLKNVIMSHTLEDVCKVAEFANEDGVHVFYQPIEQNYNTEEDPEWFLKTDNWPKDTDKVVKLVERLIEMKKQGYHIDNSFAQLEAMIPYFQNPAAHRVAAQFHSAHERVLMCSALTTLQFQSNGDVRICSGHEPVGNIKQTPIREIWEKRPRLWEQGCCLEHRLTPAEKELVELKVAR